MLRHSNPGAGGEKPAKSALDRRLGMAGLASALHASNASA
jgi:hypothetical protein